MRISQVIRGFAVGAVLLTLFAVAHAQREREPRQPRSRREAARPETPTEEGQPATDGTDPADDPRPRPAPTLHPLFVHPVMVALDTERDGVLSEEEIDAAVSALKKLDQDSDGRIITAELLAFMQGPVRDGEGNRLPRPRRGPGEEGTDSASDNPLVERFMRHDQNMDGKVSKEDLPRAMQRSFERYDADGDGSLTAEEIAQSSGRTPSRTRGRRGSDNS
jgi:Ca2+-binding EF-hand superfamily protein